MITMLIIHDSSQSLVTNENFAVHVPMILLAQHISKKGHLYQEIKLCQKCGVSYCPSHLTYVCAKHIS